MGKRVLFRRQWRRIKVCYLWKLTLMACIASVTASQVAYCDARNRLLAQHSSVVKVQRTKSIPPPAPIPKSRPCQSTIFTTPHFFCPLPPVFCPLSSDLSHRLEAPTTGSCLPLCPLSSALCPLSSCLNFRRKQPTRERLQALAAILQNGWAMPKDDQVDVVAIFFG